MSESIPVTDAARRLPDLVERLKDPRESFVLVRNGEEVGRLVPATSRKSFTVGDLLALLDKLGPPDPSFVKDLEEIRQAQPKLRLSLVSV